MASLRQILEKLLEKFVPEIRGAFTASIQDIVDNVILADVINAIKEGDLDKAFRAIGYSDAAMRPLTAALERAFETGGVTVGTTFPRVLNTTDGRAVFRFDVRNSRAEAWLRDQSSRLVTQIGDDTRTAVRQFLTDGMQDGRNPRNVALDMIGRVDATSGRRSGGIIGLTPAQERWTARTGQMLRDLDPQYLNRALRDKRFDRTVAKAIRDGKPLDADTIAKLVARYKDNALKYRGEVIARTEAIQSLNRSEYEALKQAADTGAMKPGAVQRIWDSAGDDRVRHSHKEMDGQSVGLDEPFVFPGGARAMFPGDTSLGAPAEETIQCRCRVRTEVDWFDGLAPAKKQETPAQRNAKIDAELKASVLSDGRTSGREFLAAYDAETGQIVGRMNGTTNFVGVSPELKELIENPNKKIVVHHNHPKSSSFSKQDLQMMIHYPGLKGVWAHGHNGSSFYVERGEKLLTEFQISKAMEIERRKMQEMVNQRKITPQETNYVYNHSWMLNLKENGFVKYTADLQDNSATTWEKI